MSNKLNKKINKDIKKPKYLNKLIKNILLFVTMLGIGLFSLYYYLHYTEGFVLYFSKYNIQEEYARFLIEMNDSFIEKMVMFEEVVVSDKKPEDYNKYELQKIEDIIVTENNILSRLENTPPNSSNLDYSEIYENIKEAFALYIQGQIMKVEYIYQTNENISEEKFTIGDSVTTLTGNFIIEYGGLVNKIRGTEYAMKYSVLDGLGIITGDAEQVPVERDEDGNVIIDENKNYIYLPEDTATKEDTKEDKNLTEENLNSFIDDFSNIQNEKTED